MITTIIEKYLSAVDQATFQKLMNHLLSLEGYKFISSPGSVIGKNKTSKGSPDSFFEDKDDSDKYVFCEFTTQEKLSTGQSFFKKLVADVEHCFNVAVTGIDKSEISKVVLGFTEEITVSEHNALKEQVKGHNSSAKLIIYSIQEIPFRLIYYPGLADKYIAGVKTTKGTLYTLPDFLKTTEKGLQPSLTNPFFGREDEIKEAKEHLLEKDILIITGHQGVGKSKLAAHLAELLESELEFEPRVIASSPVPLWDDLSTFILPSNKYVIFFDDANKSLPNLDYLLQFINGRDEGTTKVVITVRDYVRNDLNRYLLDVPYNELILRPFTDEQIKEIIKQSLPENISLDPMAMEKILSLSKGNSRLALMAVSAILKDNNLTILDNAFSIYDQYFQKVKVDISILDNQQYLKALGILSFFGVLDKRNDGIKEIIESHFSIKWDDLWETILEMEKVELVDVFYKEAAKISDQVLRTYVFYKTFIDEHSAIIDYSDWLGFFIEQYAGNVNSSLIDVINTFGYVELKDSVISLISKYQKHIESDDEKLYKFFSIFWFYREIDTLLFIKKWIGNLEAETTELADIKYTYEVNDFVWAPEYLNLLINFWRHNSSFTKDAIDLGLKLMFKQPSQIPEVLKHIKENLTFHRFDCRYDFPRQHTLIDELDNEKFDDRDKEIANQLFLSAAPPYLGWEYHQMESHGGGEMISYNFSLWKTNSLMELRKKILEKVFSLFERNEEKILTIMNKYAWVSNSFDSTIYADEQPMIRDFIKQNLKSDNYSHCKFVLQYVNTLKERNIELLNEWEEFLNSDSMQIAGIFNSQFYDDDLKSSEREEKRRKNLKDYINGKDINFIEETFDKLDIVYNDASLDKDTFWINSSLSIFFQILAETDVTLYYKALELLMIGKYSFELTYGNIILYPIRKKLVDIKELYQYLNRYEYKQKHHWKQMFFDAIERSDIDEFLLSEFIGFIASSENFYMYELDKKIKFDRQFQLLKSKLTLAVSKHNNIVTYIVEILLDKSETADISFDSETCEKCSRYFTNRVDLLKRIFYLKKKKGGSFDYNGKEMQSVSSLDHFFLIEYLTEISKDMSAISFKFDRLNLLFIWNLPEYEEILDKALAIIISNAPVMSNFEHQANVLFKGLKQDDSKREIAYAYISRFISNNYQSKRHIHIILNVVTYSFNDQVLRFLREFLLLNNDIEFMKNLWLEKNGAVSGSRVPQIEAYITFMQSIIDMIKTLSNPLDYAEHIKKFEQEIEWARQDKQVEMKRDFTGWFD